MQGTGGYEHIWVDNIKRQDNSFTATLADDPVRLPGMRLGSPVTFTQDQISDWVMVREGRYYGFFTTRVMLARLSPQERAQYAAIEQALTDELP